MCTISYREETLTGWLIPDFAFAFSISLTFSNP